MGKIITGVVNNMGKILKFPDPVDKNGEVLTAEQIEEMSQEAEYIEVPVVLGSDTVKCSVAVDFEKVGASEDRAYQKFKSKLLRSMDSVFKEVAPKNSKFTNVQAEENEARENLAIMEKMMDLLPEQTDVMLNLLFPQGEYFDQIILGHNIPNVPQTGTELKKWFEGGARNSRMVLEAIVAAYDPTNPLAGMQRATRGAMEQMENKTPEQIVEMAKIASAETASPSPNLTLLPTDTSETSSSTSQGLGDVEMEAGSSICETEKPLSTDSPSPSIISETISQEVPTEDSSPGGANHCGSVKNTETQEILELTSPDTSGDAAPQS
jgi:hypothetical protein